MHRRRFLTLGAAVAALPAARPSAAPAPVIVGGKAFTEQRLLAEMTAVYLAALGYAADTRAGLPSAVARRALGRGRIDLYWEYVSTSLVVFNGKVPTEIPDGRASFARVKELDGERGVVWLAPTGVDNRYVLAMRRPHAEALDLESLDDLVRHIERGWPRLAINTEFAGRRDGLHGLEWHYGFTWPRNALVRTQTPQLLPALDAARVDVAAAFATHGALRGDDLYVVRDSGGFFPDYTLAPVVRADLLDRHPGLADALEKLSTRIAFDAMQDHIHRVEIEGRRIGETARAYLAALDLPAV